MIVMPANNTSWLVHYWAGRYGNVGHLFSPGRVETPYPHLPYGLDNGAFGCWKNGSAFDKKSFLKHVDRYAYHALRPSWLIVPDVVANAEATFENWHKWAYNLLAYNTPLAIAVQDGMTPNDVQKLSIKPDLIFVGGTTKWKWATVATWCKAFPRVHVGRVNTAKFLQIAAAAGAESVDGTGWFRGRTPQLLELGHFLRVQAGHNDADDVERVVHFSRLKHLTHRALPFDYRDLEAS